MPLADIQKKHRSLETRVSGHEGFFARGSEIIDRLLAQEPSGYGNQLKDDALVYVAEIFEHLYHVEGDRAKFKQYFREHVVGVEDGEMNARANETFAQQNAYLRQWISFAKETGLVSDRLGRRLDEAMDALIQLKKYTERKGNRLDPRALRERSDSAFEVMYRLKGALREYSLQHFHGG